MSGHGSVQMHPSESYFSACVVKNNIDVVVVDRLYGKMFLRSNACGA